MKLQATVVIKITPAIAFEYDTRLPDYLPLDKLLPGNCTLTLEEAKDVLADAEFNSDITAQDVGPYGMPLGTFNAYRALARQIRRKLGGAA
jgi:hypothetical protein